MVNCRFEGSSFLPDITSSWGGFLCILLMLPIEHVLVVWSNPGRTPRKAAGLRSQARFALRKLSAVETVLGRLGGARSGWDMPAS